MADHKTDILRASWPFENTPINFCGPFKIVDRRGRGKRTEKDTYVCIFVCKITGAMHIEMAGDLSAATTAAALKRFTTRQGEPRTITSDGGTNFVAIKKRLDICRKKEEEENKNEKKN
jgi:hypothetical protein